MPLRTTDTILGPPRVSEAILGGIIARLDRPDQKDRDALHALKQRSEQAGVDDGVAVTMFLHETGNLTAPRWNEDTNNDGAIDLNMAGIGIPSNSTVQPFKLANVDDAACLFVNCLYAAVTGKRSPRVPVPASAEDWFTRVWLAKVTHPNFPGVRTVADLNTRYAANNDLHATWAWDDRYPAKLVSRAAEFMPALPDQGTSQPPKEQPPMSLTYGRVPHPPFRDLIVNNQYWNDLGQRRAIGVCQHSMVGTLSGSYNYILPGGGGQALWDYSVGGATDGANDGVIWRHNDPRGRRAGWANGGSDGLEGDGPLFVRTLGIDAINRDLVSIERSDGGKYLSQPMSPKQFEAIAQLTAYWFDQARVPWDQYPFNPNVGCVTHMIHKEFATKDCPFPPVYNEISRLQNRVRAIMKAAQTQAVEQPDTETPPPTPIEQDHDRYPNGWTAGDLKTQWGVLPRVNPGGSVTSLHFAVTKNPIAAIANTWVQRGAADGIKRVSDLPKPQLWQVLQTDADTKSDLITFEGGRDAWMLFRPNKWVPWTWIDESALKAKDAV